MRYKGTLEIKVYEKQKYMRYKGTLEIKVYEKQKYTKSDGLNRHCV
jgi:hypothetical protein